MVRSFNRAVKRVAHNIKIWEIYTKWVVDNMADEENEIQRVFDEAFRVVGNDYRSLPLWEIYLDYQLLQPN